MVKEILKNTERNGQKERKLVGQEGIVGRHAKEIGMLTKFKEN